MVLRINSNLPALIALRNLNLTEGRQRLHLERLSTGQRINASKDDPFGISLSETLRAQIRALRQASHNARDAGNLVSVAETALSQITDLLHDIRGSILFALNGSASPNAIAAEQESVNSALSAIRRIAATTRFGDVPLLDGQAGFDLENVSAGGILEVRPLRVRFNPTADPTPFTVDVVASATQATAVPGAVAGGDVTIRIDGPRGTETLNLASGTTASGVAAAIDSLRGYTGVYASGASVFTETFGEAARLRIEVLGGGGTIGGLGTGSVLFEQGSDAAATIQGQTVSGQGRLLAVDNPFFFGEIELQPGAFGTYGFEIHRSGLLFQLGARTTAANQETIGIANMSPETLGKPVVTIGGEDSGGFLSSLATGEANDLFTNPSNALHILDLALEDVSAARSALGAFVSNVVEPSERVSNVAVENLSAADSTLRDADFAEEIAALTQQQVLFQSGIAVLGQAQRLPESVLQLLTG